MKEPDGARKQQGLYHGWELADGTVAWQLIYQGVVQRLAGMAHGWRQPHRVRLESQDSVAARLKQRIGAPADTGERRPFMRGTYLARGELIRVVEAAAGEITRTGSGSATVQILGTYRGDYLQDYLLEGGRSRSSPKRASGEAAMKSTNAMMPARLPALVFAPPARPPEGRRANWSARGARAIRRIAYTSGEARG